MANRTPGGYNLGRARLQPVASPVDTYARSNAGSGLSQLAESLKQVAPEVAKYSDVAMQQQNESQKAAGEQKAREIFQSGVTAKEAIKKGLISPAESKWFQLGAQEQFGRLSAARLASDTQDAVNNSPQLQESTNVDDYDKFVADYQKKWLADNLGDENRGLNFEHGFGSLSDNFNAGQRTQFVQQAGNRLVKTVGDRHYGEVFTNARLEYQAGTKPEAIAEGIMLLNDRFTAVGGNPDVANRAVVKALGDLAQSTGDVSILDILKHVKAGNQMLDARPWAQEEIQKVTHQIWEDKQAHHNADARAAEEKYKAESREFIGNIVSQWVSSDNPSRLNFRAQIAEFSKTHPEVAAELQQTQNVLSAGAFESDVNAKQTALADIFKPVGDKDYVDVHTLVGLLNSRQINAQDFITLKSQIDERDAAAEREKNGAKNPYNDPQFSHSLTSLGQQIQAGKPDEMYAPEVIKRLNGAQAEYGQAWLEYMKGAGQTATYLEKNEWLEKTLLAITKKWQPPRTARDANRPGVPTIDLRSPQMKAQMRSMAQLMDSQARNNTGFSPGVLNFMRANGITDAAAFVKQYADHE